MKDKQNEKLKAEVGIGDMEIDLFIEDNLIDGAFVDDEEGEEDYPLEFVTCSDCGSPVVLTFEGREASFSGPRSIVGLFCPICEEIKTAYVVQKILQEEAS